MSLPIEAAIEEVDGMEPSGIDGKQVGQGPAA